MFLPSSHPWLVALACAPLAALAQSAATPSRISTVTLYPGSATVTRQAPVAAGSRSLVLDCLPAALDARSLQARSSPGVRLGDVRIALRERTLASDCASALDARIHAAENQLAQARAEHEALELATTYLQAQAQSPAAPGAGGKPALSTAALTSALQALRESAQDTLVRRHQSQQRVQAQERTLQALQAERDQNAPAQVARVTIALQAEQAGTLDLSYQLRGPSWSPSYRATLDSARAQVQIERLALVRQHTGEDWSGVALTLSTGAPLAATSGQLPRPWTLDVAPPPAAPAPMLAAPAPAAALALRKSTAREAQETEEAPADFAVQTTEGRYTTTFTVPQRVDVASGAQQVALALGQQALAAELITRTAPRVQASAWLVAQLPPPEGIWPAGPVTLYRDGALVGQGRFDPADSARWREGLAFGRDERVQVSVEPAQRQSASAGFAGGQTERRIEYAWRIENRHDQPIVLQVLDAAPVSQTDQIHVQSHYTPAPTDTAWNQQPGTTAWQQPLAAGGALRFTAQHVLRHAKDVRVRERQ